jgi:6,7-dimethyl-8-ribityllumazine synthase
MAQTSYTTSNLPQIPGARTAIVMSKWHREHSEVMAAKCAELLVKAGAENPQVHVLPGCIEIPLAARRLAQRDPNLEAVIVFGIIVKGDTYHFDMVMKLSMTGLERVMFECDIPVINEILPVTKIEDAIARCSDDQFNKGIEAALAAIEVIDWRRKHLLP